MDRSRPGPRLFHQYRPSMYESSARGSTPRVVPSDARSMVGLVPSAYTATESATSSATRSRSRLAVDALHAHEIRASSARTSCTVRRRLSPTRRTAEVSATSASSPRAMSLGRFADPRKVIIVRRLITSSSRDRARLVINWSVSASAR